MHETDAARTVANPRRTRLGAEWTAQSTGEPGPQPTPSPAGDPGSEARDLG